MKNKVLKTSTILFVVAILLSWSGSHASSAAEDQRAPISTPPTKIELSYSLSSGEPIFYRQLSEDFEDGTLDPWTTNNPTSPANIWGIRDTLDTWGPPSCAVSGYQYAGYPATDLHFYPEPGDNPGWLIYLTSPTIDITGWDSLFFSFWYLGDFEGPHSNFDGGIIEISNNGGSSYMQIDSLQQGHLNPTYDCRLAGSGGYHDSVAFAYCWTTNPTWVAVASQDLIGLGYASPGNQVKFRFVFTCDALAGGQGWFIDDIYAGPISSPDFQPPTIVHTALTDTLLTHTPFLISAEITDEGAGIDVDSVYLVYHVNEDPWVYILMTNTNGDTFEAHIGPQWYHNDVYYYIKAADLASPPNIGVTDEYYFEVTTAITMQLDDGQPYWSPQNPNPDPGDGLFNWFNFADFPRGGVAIDSGLLHKISYYFTGSGTFDIHLYEWGGFLPGDLIDSILGLTSEGNLVQMYDITDLDVRIYDGHVVAGMIAGFDPHDTTVVLMDPVANHPQCQFGWNTPNPGWNQSPYASQGDFMIRLKVIPLPLDSDTVPGVIEVNIKPQKPAFWLYQNRPNPMVKSSVIEFQVPTVQHVSLQIYNVAGQLIKTLIHDTKKDAGTHRVYWNGLDEKGQSVANGIYFYQLKGETETLTRKMVITR